MMGDELNRILDELAVDLETNSEFSLENWMQRYPAYAAEMREYERFSLLVDGSQAVQVARAAQQQASANPISSIVEAGRAVGLEPARFAWLLGIGRATLAKLERHAIDYVSIPVSMVRQIGQHIGRSTEDVHRYLESPGTGMPAMAFMATHSPTAPAAREAGLDTFMAAIAADPEIPEEGKEAWRQRCSGAKDGGQADE